MLSPRTRANPVVPIRVCHMPRIKHTYRYTSTYIANDPQKSSFTHLILQVRYRWVQTSFTSLGLTKDILNRNLSLLYLHTLTEFGYNKNISKIMVSSQGHHHSLNDLLLPRTRIGGVEVAKQHFRLTCN